MGNDATNGAGEKGMTEDVKMRCGIWRRESASRRVQARQPGFQKSQKRFFGNQRVQTPFALPILPHC